eukprot:scaffold98741_cov26-Tisochrysis_lutea.AAC.1
MAMVARHETAPNAVADGKGIGCAMGARLCVFHGREPVRHDFAPVLHISARFFDSCQQLRYAFRRIIGSRHQPLRIAQVSFRSLGVKCSGHTRAIIGEAGHPQ